MTKLGALQLINKVDLPADRFENPSLENLKAKNFIFGKNGTGKTSISHAILKQYNDQFDIHLFEGFNSVVGDNHILDAISLGTKNASVQPLIEATQKELVEINKDLEPLDDQGTNTYSELQHIKEQVKQQKKSLDDCYIKSAKKIKNEHQQLVNNFNYNKNCFIKDIQLAHKLTTDEVKVQTSLLNQEVLGKVNEVHFPTIEPSKYLQAVNKILEAKLIKSALINFRSKEDQEWARQGLNLHKHSNGEYEQTCSFCGSPLSSERIEELNSYFSDEVKKLEIRINNVQEQLKQLKKSISNIMLLDENSFYNKFKRQVTEFNLQVETAKTGYMNFLNKLSENIQTKKNDVFTHVDPINNNIVESLISFNELQQSHNTLLSLNTKYGNNLDESINNARRQLLGNQIAIQLDAFQYTTKKDQLNKVQGLEKKYEIEFNKRKDERNIVQQKLNGLKKQSVDEELAANIINEKLQQLGNQSFTLVEVKDADQKGQYTIKGLDNRQRSINTLSTGEKNIVAFLWFISSLEGNSARSINPKVILFDDPMTSNDDACQYLIISELQRLIKKNSTDQLFIFTHNIHFYLNTRYKWWKDNRKSSYNKTTYHLHKVDGKTQINMLTSPSEDLKNSYDELWEEVKWLYNNQKPSLMLNPLRRIFETYCKFNNIDLSELYAKNPQAKKYFDVNSHDIDDPGTDPNGKNETEILKEVKDIFNEIGALNHFNAHWKENS